MKGTQKQTVPCPECQTDLRFKKVPYLGQILSCTRCNAQLEVVEQYPLELDWASSSRFVYAEDDGDKKRKKRTKRRKSVDFYADNYQ